MSKALDLLPGKDQPAAKDGEDVIRDTVAKYLPEHAKIMKDCLKNKAELLLHQDAFAAGYNVDELILLGMMIKMCGFYGVPVRIHGRNHETF